MDTVTTMRHWAGFLAQIRAFFDGRGFTEVTTRHLVPAGAFEGVIDSLQVRHSKGGGELHTSPEMEMKALLAQTGLSSYQICRCFRDDPLETGVHGKEFTMLEFYRVDEDYAGIRELMKELLAALGYGGEIPEKTVAELMAGREPIPEAGERWEDAFFKIFIQEVEPNLPADPPTLVKDYPAQIAALGALNPDRRTAQRFEIYWKGMEICNGCVELGDIGELEARIRAEAELREQAGKRPHPRPERLVAALQQGLPPCAGVAVGLDRLFKCLTGQFPPGFP
jgi:elongation factor P--(R)-beta-lysine ligase